MAVAVSVREAGPRGRTTVSSSQRRPSATLQRPPGAWGHRQCAFVLPCGSLPSGTPSRVRHPTCASLDACARCRDADLPSVVGVAASSWPSTAAMAWP